MKRYRKRDRLFFRSSVLVALCVCLLTSCTINDRILRVSDGSVITLSEMVEDLKGVRLVFVGELHTHRSHHRMQLEIIKALSEAGVKVAVGFEMFRVGSQEDLDRWVAGELGVEEFKDVYRDNWSVAWDQYDEIFFYARKNSIPMVGINIPRKIPAQVAQSGFDSVTVGQLDDLPGVECDVDPRYKEFIRKALGKHEEKGRTFQNFCEAQMVWDSTMAWNLIKFLKQNPGYTVVVVAGNGHSWKPGIPWQVRRREDVPFRVVLPEVSERLKRTEVTRDDTDYLWLGLWW